MLHFAPIISIKTRVNACPGAPTAHGALPEELLVLHADGLLALITGASVTKALRDCAPDLWQDLVGGGGGVPSPAAGLSAFERPDSDDVQLEVCKVMLTGNGLERQAFADFVPCGQTRGSALDVFREGADRCVLVAGTSPTVASYNFRLEAEHFSAGAVLTAVGLGVTRVGVAVLKGGMKTMGRFFGGSAPEPHAEPEGSPTEAKPERPQDKAATHTMNDPDRAAATISLDYTGRFVAVTDQLGRVLIIDVPMLCIVNVLKGYRDSQVGWLHNPQGVEPSAAPLRGKYMVLHLPRRGVVEMWKVGPHMARVSARKVGYGCRLTQAAVEFSASAASLTRRSNRKPYSCYLMTANGDLHFVDAVLSFKQKRACVAAPCSPPPTPDPGDDAEVLANDHDEFIRLLSNVEDDPREVLRVVLQAHPPKFEPEFMQHLTLLATEKLRETVFATHIARQDPLPAHTQREDVRRTEYERCLAGPTSLAQPLHIYQYLAQRYAVLQAYCLLAPYAVSNGGTVSGRGADDDALSQWPVLFCDLRADPRLREWIA